jgi:tRNA(fMet)-specific endonuclease VapC
MMLQFLLDTSVVSSPMVHRPNARMLKRMAQHGEQSAIAATVWHELLFGVERLPPGERRRALEHYVRSVLQPSFPILPYDDRAAAWHALERARLEKVGKTPPFADGQIAAIAASNELTLVTANSKHFALFKDLELADWTR